MKILMQYDPQIEKWHHADFNKFMGGNKEEFGHIFGLSPEDKTLTNCCYFNTGAQKIITNNSNGEVFFGKVVTTYKIQYKDLPTAEFLFPLFENGMLNFATVFHQKTQQTNLSHHKIVRPVFSNFQDELNKHIDYWNRHIRSLSHN